MKGRQPSRLITGSQVLTDMPRAPAWLSPAAKAEWRRVAPILVDRGILTEADLGTLEGYATAMGRVREAEKTIRAEGSIYVSASGPKRHPAVTLQDAALKTARLFANELGLTPVARSRAAIQGGPSDDDDRSPLDF
ncbi:phage terminase small subunit P27 family [Aurantimonas coralicida]|uniref:phage terminase small subunit P27 family n=1 Tax=Aurantimonas coralicida TaxID=182270 RepID=UPI001D189607|nr:phage terminase small subunit P27 family [Aurantimonas coralicida]MCC4298130.1 phage terminase small subunit P27 family [Aurantimonas coralicida]